MPACCLNHTGVGYSWAGRDGGIWGEIMRWAVLEDSLLSEARVGDP